MNQKQRARCVFRMPPALIRHSGGACLGLGRPLGNGLSHGREAVGALGITVSISRKAIKQIGKRSIQTRPNIHDEYTEVADARRATARRGHGEPLPCNGQGAVRPRCPSVRPTCGPAARPCSPMWPRGVRRCAPVPHRCRSVRLWSGSAAVRCGPGAPCAAQRDVVAVPLRSSVRPRCTPPTRGLGAALRSSAALVCPSARSGAGPGPSSAFLERSQCVPVRLRCASVRPSATHVLLRRGPNAVLCRLGAAPVRPVDFP
jgi:hypothetical protein